MQQLSGSNSLIGCSRPGKINNKGWKLLKQLVKKNYVTSVKLLLERGVRCPSFDQKAADELKLYCSRKGYVEILKLLLDYGISAVNCIDDRKRTSLHYAAMGGAPHCSSFID